MKYNIGVSRQAVSKWERAEASPDTDNLILLSKLYGVSMDELLSTDEPVETKRQSTDAIADEEKHGTDRPCSHWMAFPYPIIVTMIYLLLGFVFNLWHPAWLLFVTIPLYYSLVGFYCKKNAK